MTTIDWFHPFTFLFYNRHNFEPFDDLGEYGFSLDLTTAVYYYTYDWGYGFCFRILGFGLEISKVKV